MKKPMTASNLQPLSRAHYTLHETKAESRVYGECMHNSTHSTFLISNPPPNDRSDDSSSEDSSAEYSQEQNCCSPNLGKLFPPPNPLPPKALMYLKEPLRVGANIPLLNLERFSTLEEPKAPFLGSFKGLAADEPATMSALQIYSGTDCMHCSLKRFITSEVTSSQVVYERRFPKSMPQQKRDSYFLTEMYNVRRLIQRQGFIESDVDCALRPAHAKAQSCLISRYYNPQESDRTLVFESRFESGNLCLAIKVSEDEYNLFMQNDVNTQGHTQWFFFRVENTTARAQVKFNILNFSKPDSLYNKGMQIAVYSQKKYDKQHVAWHRDGKNIHYTANGIRKGEGLNGAFYTLSFVYEFQYSGDTVFFAYSHPYTYTDLTDSLNTIERDERKSEFCLRKTLCRTIAGNRCEYLAITARGKDGVELAKRKGVVITARVHPGETVGSWMMQGVMDFLTDPNDSQAELLRRNFVFKIIPMLNPDGVINGNYRCSLAGCDLNRRWHKPDKLVHPTVYHAKNLIKRLDRERGLVFYCDLHGHSRKKNVFMYGCNEESSPEKTRLFPMILSKVCPFFSFQSSRFGVQKSKASTSRITLYSEIGIPNVFTLEASFLGCDSGEHMGLHLTNNDLKQVGRDVCRSLIYYFGLSTPSPSTPMSGGDSSPFEGDMNRLKEKSLNELVSNKELIDKGNDENSSSGSEDCPSDDNFSNAILSQLLPTTTRKKRKIMPSTQIKDELRTIFGLGKKKSADKPESKPKPKPKEEKKKEPPKSLERKLEKPVPKPEPTLEEDKKDQSQPHNNVVMVDAWTQTDRIDFARAHSKMVMSRFGKSRYRKNFYVASPISRSNTVNNVPEAPREESRGVVKSTPNASNMSRIRRGISEARAASKTGEVPNRPTRAHSRKIY